MVKDLDSCKAIKKTGAHFESYASFPADTGKDIVKHIVVTIIFA